MKKARERRESVSNSGVASASEGSTNKEVPEDECNTETKNIIDSDDHSLMEWKATVAIVVTVAIVAI